MRHLLLLIGLLYAAATTTATAQDYKNWTVAKTTDGDATIAMTDGVVVKGKTLRGETTRFASMEYLSDDGSDAWTLAILKANYKFDTSGDNKNFLMIDVIVDNNPKLTYQGEIYNDDGAVRFYKLNDGPSRNTLYEQMLEGTNVWIRVYLKSHSSSEGDVYKYSLSGFTAADSKNTENLQGMKSNVKNPFSKADDNPFKG